MLEEVAGEMMHKMSQNISQQVEKSVKFVKPIEGNILYHFSSDMSFYANDGLLRPPQAII